MNEMKTIFGPCLPIATAMAFPVRLLFIPTMFHSYSLEGALRKHIFCIYVLGPLPPKPRVHGNM